MKSCAPPMSSSPWDAVTPAPSIPGGGISIGNSRTQPARPSRTYGRFATRLTDASSNCLTNLSDHRAATDGAGRTKEAGPMPERPTPAQDEVHEMVRDRYAELAQRA